MEGARQHSTMISILASGPSCPGLDSKKIVNVSEANQWRCLEKSEQWLCNVERTHLILASGKQVLQKIMEVDKTANHIHAIKLWFNIKAFATSFIVGYCITRF